MDAILKALSVVMNENRRNKMGTVIKQLNMREYSKDAYSLLNNFIRVIFLLFHFSVFSESNVLHSERC